MSKAPLEFVGEGVIKLLEGILSHIVKALESPKVRRLLFRGLFLYVLFAELNNLALGAAGFLSNRGTSQFSTLVGALSSPLRLHHLRAGMALPWAFTLLILLGLLVYAYLEFPFVRRLFFHVASHESAWLSGGKSTGEKNVGGARWAKTSKDLDGMLGKPDPSWRFRVGRWHNQDVYLPAEFSVALIGAAGSGKTLGVLAYAGLQDTEANQVFVSVKGDTLKHTYAWRQHMANKYGGTVKIFDPAQYLSKTYPTYSWSILAGCEAYGVAMKRAEQLTDAASTSDRSGNATSDFFAHQAASVLSPLLWAAANVPGCGIKGAREIVQTADAERLLGYLDDLAQRPELASEADLAIVAANSVLSSKADTTVSNVWNTCQNALRAYGYPQVLESVESLSAASDQFDPREFVLGKGNTLYMVVPPGQSAQSITTLYTALIATIYEEGMNQAEINGGALATPLQMLVDEAANVCPLPLLGQFLAECRAAQIRWMLVFQDIAQMERRWHEDTYTILTNAQATVILPGSKDVKLLEWVQKMGGNMWIETTSESKSHRNGDDGASTSTSRQEHPLISPDELRRLPRDEAILLCTNYHPVQLKMTNVFKHRLYSQRLSENFHASRLPDDLDK